MKRVLRNIGLWGRPKETSVLVDSETVNRLEDELGDLAVRWRRKPDNAIVTMYHQLYKRLVKLGWDQSLDVESRLPNELMP